MPARAPRDAQEALARNDIGGTVHGPSVQARDIQGDVHVHQVAPAPPSRPTRRLASCRRGSARRPGCGP
jgi:hypothetical protein